MNEQLQLEATEILEVLEDTVAHICNENYLSGEKVWCMIESLANAKMSDFPTND